MIYAKGKAAHESCWHIFNVVNLKHRLTSLFFSSSGFTDLYFHRGESVRSEINIILAFKRIVAVITILGKRKYLGCYATAEEAALSIARRRSTD